MALIRFPDWRLRLDAYLQGCRAKIYAPGRFDCAIFAAGAVEAMTGVDLSIDWRGRYRTLRGGLRQLKAAGYADHIALAAAHFEAVAPAMASHGDLAVIDGDDGPALGVVVGPQILALHPQEGLVAVSILSATGAFRV